MFSSTLKMEAIRSSETPVNTISTRRHIPEDCSLDIHRRENLESYIGGAPGEIGTGHLSN
jgi:hypothetical protein